jgi:hypothetical protein
MKGSLTDAILAPHRQILNVELAGVVLDCPGGERVPETVGVDLGHASLPAEVVRGFFMQVATESTMMRSGRTLMARITIDELGKVDPAGAAYVETTLPRPIEHVKAGPHNLPPNAPVATVQYQCRRCDRSFWATAGQVTVHDC